MRYMFLIYLDERASEARSEAEIKAGIASHVPYIEQLRRNRQFGYSDPLAPSRSARTLRGAGGKPVVTEGPFAESREQFGGFYVIAAEDLDQAIATASQCPALATVGIGIEIRPLLGGGVEAPAGAARDGERRFLLAIHRSDERDERAAWSGYLERMRAAGTLERAEQLAPPGSATSLRLRDGNVVLGDGPFLEQPAHIAATCIVRARDLDEAVQLARDYPDARDAIEVRPIRPTAIPA